MKKLQLSSNSALELCFRSESEELAPHELSPSHHAPGALVRGLREAPGTQADGEQKTVQPEENHNLLQSVPGGFQHVALLRGENEATNLHNAVDTFQLVS